MEFLFINLPTTILSLIGCGIIPHVLDEFDVFKHFGRADLVLVEKLISFEC